MAEWNAAYEADPADGKDISLGAGDIRTDKVEVRTSCKREHEWQNSDDTKDGLHRCDATSGKFKIRDSTLATDIFTVDETAKTLKIASGYEYQNSDGRDVDKRYREVVWTIMGALITGDDGVALIYLPMESGESATIIGMKLLCKTAPTGDAVTVKLQKWGAAQDPTDTPTDIGSVSISAGAFKAYGTLSGSVAEDEYLAPTITNIGSTVAGEDLSIHVILEY